MPSTRNTILVCALALSVSINVVFLLRPKASSTSNLAHDVAEAGQKSSPDRTVRSGIKHDECVTLRQRLANAESNYELGRPLNERFETATRVYSDEERLRPLLAKVFPDAEQYDLECREHLCRIIVDDDRAPDNWWRTFQTEPALQGHFSKMLFSSEGVTVELQDEAAAHATQLWLQVFRAMGDSSALKECKQSNPAPVGEVVITLTLAASRRLEANVSGSLANQSAGVCMRRVMEELLRQISVPSTVTNVPDQPIPIKVP